MNGIILRQVVPKRRRAVGSLLANPFDLLKVRMQGGDLNTRTSETWPEICPVQTASCPSLPVKLCVFSGFKVMEATKAVYREAGITGLWRGAGPTVQRATLLTASQAQRKGEFTEFKRSEP
eukprot:Skav236307  [mRNA]  locus=scaffold97:13806:14286:+ [translate_table: standard]